MHTPAVAPATLLEYKIRASLLLKALRSNTSDRSIRAAERFRLFPPLAHFSAADVLALKGRLQLKHALAVVAREAGYPDWNTLKANAQPGLPRVDRLPAQRAPRPRPVPDPRETRRRLPTELQLMYWIDEMQSMPEHPRNAWLQRDGAQVYVRAGERWLDGRWATTLEIANWSFSKRQRGKDRILAILDLAERLNPWDAVYVELPGCECLRAYLRSDGWLETGEARFLSFYRLRDDFALLAGDAARQEVRRRVRAARRSCELCA